MDEKSLFKYLGIATQVFQAVATAQQAISRNLPGVEEATPKRIAEPIQEYQDTNLVKIFLPEIGTASGECIWAQYLGNELYKLDNYPVNPDYHYGDLVRAVGGGAGRVPYVITWIAGK